MPGAVCVIVGSKTRQNWLPMEVCVICPGQRVKKLDPMQASQMPKLVLPSPPTLLAKAFLPSLLGSSFSAC